MKYIAGETDFKLYHSAVSLGKFDGLHIGHQLLLHKILDLKKEGYTSVMFSFLYHPGNLFNGKPIQLIDTEQEKKRKLEENGLDVLVSYPFSSHTAKMEPEDFIKQILIDRLDARVIVAGSDFRFGHNRRGDIRMLKNYADQYHYQLMIYDKIKLHGRTVSSTLVRSELEAGHMQEAGELLGTPYFILGEVLHGRQLGRELGMPTANQLPEDNKLLPPNGVYASKTEVDGEIYNGVTNIGCKPTVGAEERKGAETFLFNYSGDLYGKTIKVELHHYIRQERKFNSIEMLSIQMHQDKDMAKEYFAKHFS